MVKKGKMGQKFGSIAVWKDKKLPSKMMMKAFVTMLKKKKDATRMEKDMAAMISDSYDISDKWYVEPIVAYVKDNERNTIE